MRRSNNLTEAGGATPKKGNCYHLIRETDRLFKTLFPESTLLNKKPETIGESYFCGYTASPEENRKTLSGDQKT